MYVIFDTNAVRDYVSKISNDEINSYVDSVIKKFKENDIKLLINPIVIQELLYHLADTKDKDYSISYKAIKAIMLTVIHQYKDAFMPMVQTSELIIAKDIFNQRIEEREKMYSNLMNLASYIVENPMMSVQEETQKDLNTNKDWIDNVENEFDEQLRYITNRIKGIYGGNTQKYFDSEESNATLATYIMRTTYNLLHVEGKIEKITLNPSNLLDKSLRDKELKRSEQLKQISESIANKYSPFITLMKSVVKRIIDSNNQIKSKKLKNYIWDILLMFNVNHLTINREKVIFVTTDNAMREAALNSDKNIYIMDFKEFKKNFMP